MSARAVLTACLLAALLVAGAARGAEPAATTPAPPAGAAGEAEPRAGAGDTAEADRDDRPEPASADEPSPEVFVPSEEISEDFTVSFPVDI